MLEDDGTLMGDFEMPPSFWRLAEATGVHITVRITGANIPTLPQLAFGTEFQRLSDIYGQRYLELWRLTGHDAYELEPTPQRLAFEQLTRSQPQAFATVVGRQGPRHVWLALPLARLTDEIADAIIAAHHTHLP